MCKPKYHYSYHVPECIDKFGETVSCFSMERRHKDAKCLSQHSPSQGFERTILRRQLVNSFAYMERCLIPEFLGVSKPMESLRQIVEQVHSPRAIGEIRASKTVTTVRGTIQADNIVLLSQSSPAGVVHRVCRAVFFSIWQVSVVVPMRARDRR